MVSVLVTSLSPWHCASNLDGRHRSLVFLFPENIRAVSHACDVGIQNRFLCHPAYTGVQRASSRNTRSPVVPVGTPLSSAIIPLKMTMGTRDASMMFLPSYSISPMVTIWSRRNPYVRLISRRSSVVQHKSVFDQDVKHCIPITHLVTEPFLVVGRYDVVTPGETDRRIPTGRCERVPHEHEHDDQDHDAVCHSGISSIPDHRRLFRMAARAWQHPLSGFSAPVDPVCVHAVRR